MVFKLLTLMRCQFDDDEIRIFLNLKVQEDGDENRYAGWDAVNYEH